MVPSALGVLAGGCCIVAGLVTLFCKETARKSEQWNRDFGARWSTKPVHWIFTARIPAVFSGLWLILVGVLFLWSVLGGYRKDIPNVKSSHSEIYKR